MKRYLQDRLYGEIPISKQMGFTVAEATLREVSIQAPLAPNINHNATVFGGTLASALLLCGWGLTELRLREWRLQGHVVVMKTEIEYLRPVESDFKATCFLDDEKQWEAFKQVLEHKKKARIQLEGFIGKNDAVQVKLKGLYAALLDIEPEPGL